MAKEGANKNTGKIAQKQGFEAKIVEKTKKKEGEKRALKKIALQAKKEKRGRTKQKKKKREAKKRADFGGILSIEPSCFPSWNKKQSQNLVLKLWIIFLF